MSNQTIQVQGDGTVSFLPHRLNRQPVIVRGLTADELWITAGLSGVAGLAMGIVLAMMFKHLALAPTFILISIALGIFAGGGMLRRQKRGRPETWLYRQIQWKTFCSYPAIGRFIGGAHLINRSGWWEVRRAQSTKACPQGFQTKETSSL